MGVMAAASSRLLQPQKWILDSSATAKEAEQKHDEEYHEEYFCDTGGRTGDSTKAEERSHQRDNQEYPGVM